MVLEGPEASGKSTQCQLLAQRLGAMYTKEPGGSPLGIRLREILLARDGEGEWLPLSPRAEALLMLADRAQHVEEVVIPALAAGKWVICDRFTPSTLAYQGAARGLDPWELEQMSDWAADRLEPDLYVYLEVGAAEAHKRRPRPADRMEEQGEEFFERVRSYYLRASLGENWMTIDGLGDPAEVTDRILAGLRSRLAPLPQEHDATG